MTVTNPGSSATGSGPSPTRLPAALDATTATWTCTPEHRVDVRVAAGEPLTGTGSPTGVPITVAPNGGTVTFTSPSPSCLVGKR